MPNQIAEHCGNAKTIQSSLSELIQRSHWGEASGTHTAYVEGQASDCSTVHRINVSTNEQYSVQRNIQCKIQAVIDTYTHEWNMP